MKSIIRLKKWHGKKKGDNSKLTLEIDLQIIWEIKLTMQKNAKLIEKNWDAEKGRLTLKNENQKLKAKSGNSFDPLERREQGSYVM